MVDARKNKGRYLAGHRLLLAVLASMFVLSACTQTTGTAVGVVTAVDGNLTEVTSFTVLSAGMEMVFQPTEGADYDFPLVHLREHLRTGEPVVVGWELDDNNDRYATSLADG